MATSTTSTPDWYQEYASDIAGAGKALAQQDMPLYEGPRQAEWTNDQQRAFAQMRDTQGMWDPYVQKSLDSFASAQGGLNSMSALALDSGNYDDSVYENTFWNNYQPAIQGMQDTANQIGMRNFNNTTLKGLNDNFTGTGQFGSGRHQILGADAAADAQARITEQQAGIMNTGRQNAMKDYLGWSQQEGQMANTMGNYATNQAKLGTDYFNFGMGTQNASMNDAKNMAAIGQQQQDFNQQGLNLAYQDYQQQMQYPWTQMSNWTSLMNGQAVPQYSNPVTLPPAVQENPWYAGLQGGAGVWNALTSSFK